MERCIKHQPVLVAEVLAGLCPVAGGFYVDGTVGQGGHAAAILRDSSPSGRLFGCDRDSQAIRAATERLAEFAGRFELRQGNYADLAQWLSPASVDGALLDLGLSSVQLAGGGFSFQVDSELDMRLDQSQSLTAAQWLNEASADELASVFWELGDEKAARRLARAIVRERQRLPITRTRQLAGLAERVAPRGAQGIHPATRIFLAIRMHINSEISALKRGLAAAWTVLKPRGRLAVISFHSGEHRVVKAFAAVLARDYDVPGETDVPALRRPRPSQARLLAGRAIRAGAAELAANPRARSAQLRVLEKLPPG